LSRSELRRHRACLAGLQLHETDSGAATPPISSSTVELDSCFEGEGKCLVETTTPAPQIDSLNCLSSFALKFFSFRVRASVRVGCVHALCVCAVRSCVLLCVVCVRCVCVRCVRDVWWCVLCMSSLFFFSTNK
jgi:hypothetical protein